MTKTEQIQAFDAFVAKMRNTLVSKADDYAGQEDRLRNFKQVAELSGTGWQQAAFVHISTKVSRISNLLSSGVAPSNESLEDSILDLANYTVLMHMLGLELEAQKTTVAGCEEPALADTYVDYEKKVDSLHARLAKAEREAELNLPTETLALDPNRVTNEWAKPQFKQDYPVKK